MDENFGFKITDAVGDNPHAKPEISILARSRRAAPELPIDVFGPFWAGYIGQAAKGANAPPDYVALPLLAAASGLIGNSRWATAWPGWNEPPVLWCASVGDPSSGKSSGASPVMRDLLKQIDGHVSRDFPAAMKAWQEKAAVAEAVSKGWGKAAAAAIKNDVAPPKRPAEADAPPKPIRPRVRVADITVEKLADILEGLPKGVLYARDELSGWFGNMSRYSNGTDRPFWLEAYVGGPHTVDRKNRPDPVFIHSLSVAIFGTIQPEKMVDVLPGVDDGLSSRFLWCWPDAPNTFCEPPAPDNIRAAIDALIRLADMTMLKDEWGIPRPSFLGLDFTGRRLIEGFAKDMQGREKAAQGLMKSAYGKARGQALRLALVLEFLWWCPSQAIEPVHISVKAVQAALALMDAYFLPMAQRVLGDASISGEERGARTLAMWIAKERPTRVNVSDIRDKARLPGLRESDAVKAAIRFLVEARWLIEVSPTTKGRPRGDYLVNPRLGEALA